MKPAQFKYFDPAAEQEALSLLHEWGDEGKVLAGGQTLGPMLNFRVVRPAALVDINRIASLAYCSHDNNGTAIGALTRQQALGDDSDLSARQPLVAAAIPLIAHRAVRNRGTVGGSLAHADPAAEWGGLLALTGAQLLVRRHNAPERTVDAAHFFLGPLETALSPDELLVEIRLPPWPRNAGWSIVEFSRRHGDFALAGIASMVALAPDGTCSDVRIAAFGVEPTPRRLTRAEDAIRQSRPTPAVLERVAREAAAQTSPMEDSQASAAYRRQLVGVLVERSLTESMKRAAPA
jgi:aerobic carbon-monoxide dehydrogenase medium subunit